MIRYRFRLWRANHRVWVADQNYRRWPSPNNRAALERAVHYRDILQVGWP